MISDATWAIAAPMLERALKHQDTHGIDDVRAAIERGEAQLWCGARSCVVTEIIEHPRRRVCRIWLAAGCKKELIEQMLVDIRKWARMQTCDKLEVVGRKGWSRVLKDFSQPHTVLECKL